MDKELNDYLLHKTAERIKAGRIRQQEIDARLAHYHLVTKIQKGVALGLAGVLATVGLSFVLKKHSSKEDKNPNTISNISINVEDENINLERLYKVEFGDSLSYLSSFSGIPINTIKQDNGIDLNDSMIKDGQLLHLNYSVDPDNLKYYTNIIDVNGKTVSEIANEYNTSVNTLCNLNKDSIIENYNEDYTKVTYTITNNNLVVPNFITPQELEEVKGNQK